MGSSVGRRDKAHIQARTYFRVNRIPCWECGGPPYAADHDPPLAHYAGNAEQWAANGGRYRSHCKQCSARQGAHMTNARRRKPTTSRTW